MPGHPSLEDQRREFTIKDSGARSEFAGGMVRDSATDKLDYTSLLYGPMLDRYIAHLTKGREKYPDPEPGVPNWTLAQGEEELIHAKRSLLRHVFQLLRDERDEDHAAAVWFNVNLIEYIRDKLAVKESVVLPEKPPPPHWVMVDQCPMTGWPCDCENGSPKHRNCGAAEGFRKLWCQLDSVDDLDGT